MAFLILGGGFALCFFGTCLASAMNAGSKGPSQQAAASPGARANSNRPPPKDVELRTLLSEYADNEVRADSNFKDHVIQTSGIVDDVKKDILDSVYITVGTGRRFETPQVQCFVADAHVKKAATLSKGARVGVRGRVQGLMMNVLVHDCEIIDL
ncbi:OB-fold protein [Myxococcus sp. 1LA]